MPFLSYGQSTNDYQVENQLLACFYEEHKKENIRIDTVIDQLELVFIQHAILEDSSGESYLKLVEKMTGGEELGLGIAGLLADIKSLGFIPTTPKCQDSAFLAFLDSTDGYNDLASHDRQNFTAKDFEHHYYQTVTLLMLRNMAIAWDFEQGISAALPPPLESEETEIPEEQNRLVILISADNKIYAKGKLVVTSELRKVVRNFITESSDKTEVELPFIGAQQVSKGIICLQNEKGTDYSVYIKCQNEIKASYREIREEYSKKYFDKAYQNLNDKQMDVIIALVPQRIKEGPPCD
ncbi:MAG TPA: hypothetical protein DIW47_07120 [Bacteroidetes bacterium]|nr:hypothetical protein [Bacteroidota bacterium]